MPEEFLRHSARWILERVTRIAPADVRDWGRAMLNELPHVESAWAALLWAIGGSLVLGKYTIVRRRIVADGGLFARNISLRKVALVASGVYVFGALLFFAAPPFRQGLRVSLTPWKALLHPSAGGRQAKISAIGKQAEARHEAEGLVFAAARVSSAHESARLAEEAVRINPGVIWVYAIVAVRHPDIPEIRRWIPALEHWQPGNALFPLIVAESIRRAVGAPGPAPAAESASSRDIAWRQAMLAAFASPKFDDYIERLEVIDRKVVREYGFDSPQGLLAGEQGGLPARFFSGARRFANSLLESGDRLEASGTWKGGAEKYWTVARFGQVVDSQAHGNYEHWAGTTLQWMAYRRLKDLAIRQGNTGEAALFAYLGKKFDPSTGNAAAALRKSVFGDYVARRNAFVLQISALMMLLFSGLLIAAPVVLIAASRSHERRRVAIQSAARGSARGLMVFVILTSAVGLLLSSATVYLTYRPYWYILQGQLLKGGVTQTGGQSSGLRSFLAAIHTLPGADRGIVLNLPVYFWAGVILAAIAALTLIFLRHLREAPRLTEAQPNSRVQ